MSPPPLICHLHLVEVYNCGAGSSDCSQCWGREAQGHLCGWCESVCKLRSECQPIRDQCPNPEIREVRSGVRHASLYKCSHSSSHCPHLLWYLGHKMVNHEVTHMVWHPHCLSAHDQLLRHCLSLIKAAHSVITLKIT